MTMTPEMLEGAGIKVKRIGNGRTRARAKAMLVHLKSYEDWVGTADPVILEVTKRIDGDLRTSYDKFRAELVKIARDGQVRRMSFDQNGALKEVVFER